MSAPDQGAGNDPQALGLKDLPLQGSLHSVSALSSFVFTVFDDIKVQKGITDVNLFPFAYRLLHEDLSSIIRAK